MDIFSTDSQKAFWKEIEPSVSLFLDNWESDEDWTHAIDDDPVIYQEFEQSIRSLNERRCSLDDIQIVREFIDLSSSLSYRYAITAICMLNDHEAPGLQNWATSCIHEAMRIIRSESDPLKSEAQVFISRIRTVLKTSLMMRIFDGNSGIIEKMVDG